MTDPLFEVIEIVDLSIDGPLGRDNAGLMSPYVWRDGDMWRLLLRVVPEGMEPTGRIWCGESTDGINFTMADAPALAPTLEHLDIGGCEDPTVIEHGDRLLVFYTGVDRNGAAEMLWASGPDAASLEKHGVAYSCSKTEKNTKEASVEIGDDGIWRLFYEYSAEDRSWIGLTFGPSPTGPWDERDDPILPREGMWDCYHLSTGPLLREDDTVIMFYNGSTEDARWAIGWARFKRDCRTLVERCEGPLITPDDRPSNGDDDQDDDRAIAFANSLVVDGDLIYLYYSHDDCVPCRATLRRR